jgi:hypothetical protein
MTSVVYKTDTIANLHEHEVLRTPVRHCELNSKELIWAQVKGFVAKNNTTFRLKNAKEMSWQTHVPNIFGIGFNVIFIRF